MPLGFAPISDAPLSDGSPLSGLVPAGGGRNGKRFKFPVAGSAMCAECCCGNTCCPPGKTFAQCCCNPGCFPWWITIGGVSQLLQPPPSGSKECKFTSEDGTATLTYCSANNTWTLTYDGQVYTIVSGACPPSGIGPATIGCPPGKVVQCAVTGVNGTWWYCDSPYPGTDGGPGQFCMQPFNLNGTIVMNGAAPTYGSPCSDPNDNVNPCILFGSSTDNSPCTCWDCTYQPATPTCFYQGVCYEPVLNGATGNTSPCSFNGSPVAFELEICLGHSALTCPCIDSQTVTWNFSAALLINGTIWCSVCGTGTSVWQCNEQIIPLPTGWTPTSSGCNFSNSPNCWSCPTAFQLSLNDFSFSYQ